MKQLMILNNVLKKLKRHKQQGAEMLPTDSEVCTLPEDCKSMKSVNQKFMEIENGLHKLLLSRKRFYK